MAVSSGDGTASSAVTTRPAAEIASCQYIFFNKAPGQGGALAWSQNKPRSFGRESCEEVARVFGNRGSSRLRVGVSFPFSIMETPPEQLAESISALLASAQAADVPVLITLDGQNWWRNREDLWNFWDPARPGYNVENRHNVEWIGWGPEHAVKICWRNWGHQIRVQPAPNIASPRVLAEHWKAYDVLIPLIVRWYESLPADKKYLFGGLKVGWEASLNVNAYYYRDGNAIFERSPDDASKDPQDHDPANGWTFGQPSLGYAAAWTANIARSGEMKKEYHEKLVHDYLAQLSAQARRRGMPRELIFTHQGGTFPPWEKHLSFKPAINDDSIPGYSFYHADPANCGSLAADLEQANRTDWAAAEWWLGAGDRAGWKTRFRKTLGFKRCRFVCVYNWGPFKADPNAVAAVRELLESAASDGKESAEQNGK